MADAKGAPTEQKPAGQEQARPGKSEAQVAEEQGQQVTTVKSKDGQSLVEWTDEGVVQRAWFPVKDVKDGRVAKVEAGLPYGDDFGKLLKGLPTAKSITQALNSAGIWSYEELRRNPQKVQDALGRAFAPVVTNLISNTEGD